MHEKMINRDVTEWKTKNLQFVMLATMVQLLVLM